MHSQLRNYRESSNLGNVVSLYMFAILFTFTPRTQIVENFIPAEEVEKVTQRAFYDEDTDEWKIGQVNPPNRCIITLLLDVRNLLCMLPVLRNSYRLLINHHVAWKFPLSSPLQL